MTANECPHCGHFDPIGHPVQNTHDEVSFDVKTGTPTLVIRSRRIETMRFCTNCMGIWPSDVKRTVTVFTGADYG